MDPSSPNDPFGQLDGQRTFIRPKPGGWSAGKPPEPEATGAFREVADAPVPEHGLNPLLAVANRLLMLAPQIRQTRQVADPAALRQALSQGIRDFVNEAQGRGIAAERVMAARYVLCTVLDEAAADTPWGGSGVWGSYSLLASFHNESWGGEKVFQLMARLAENPEANLDLPADRVLERENREPVRVLALEGAGLEERLDLLEAVHGGVRVELAADHDVFTVGRHVDAVR